MDTPLQLVTMAEAAKLPKAYAIVRVSDANKQGVHTGGGGLPVQTQAVRDYAKDRYDIIDIVEEK